MTCVYVQPCPYGPWLLYIMRHHRSDVLHLNIGSKFGPGSCSWLGKLPKTMEEYASFQAVQL